MRPGRILAATDFSTCSKEAVDSAARLAACFSAELFLLHVILGLRALYFALAGIMQLFHYLHYGLSVILVFVGAKMLLSDVYKVPIGIALSVIAGILFSSIVASILRPRQPVPSPPCRSGREEDRPPLMRGDPETVAWMVDFRHTSLKKVRRQGMLAKKTSKNQITLPKEAVQQFPGIDYFEVSVENDKIEE